MKWGTITGNPYDNPAVQWRVIPLADLEETVVTEPQPIRNMEKLYLAAFENLAQYLGKGWTASDLARLASAYGAFRVGNEVLKKYLGTPGA